MTRKCGDFFGIMTQAGSEAMTNRKIEAHESGGNIFADLALPDTDGLLLKSGIAIELHRLIKERGLTQVKAAKLLGITQPDLSHLLRGDFEDYSAERLMKMLTVFEQDIEIVSATSFADGQTTPPSSSRNGYAVVAGGARRLRRASKDGPQAQAAILRDAAQARGSSG
jgi:predicted XRE-type DNA-binding protein